MKQNNTLERSYIKDEDVIEQEALSYKKQNNKVFIPNWNNKPPYKPPILKLNGVSILSFQNITCLVASPGSGKSSNMEAIVSSVINENSDNLNFETTAKSVLYVDFERTELDVWNSFKRVMVRAKVEQGKELNYINITSFRRIPTAKQRKELVEDFIIEYKPELLLLDGIGDMVDDTNSLPEAIELKIWARQITSKYKLSIITTLHPNKNSNNPRGHIGSEMLRECENILIIKVNSDGSRTITSDFEHGKGRNSAVASGSFTWSDENSMFVSIKTVNEDKDISTSKKRIEPSDIDNLTYIEILELCFAKNDKLKYSELKNQLELAIHKISDVSCSRTFYEKTITHLLNEDLLSTSGTPRTKSFLYSFSK